MKNIKFLFVMILLSLLIACSKDGYRVEGDQVVYEVPWNTGNFTVIHNLKADPKTLQVLGDDNLTWAKDHKRVYRKYKELTFMDSETFTVLNEAIAKDKNHVICGRDIMKEANPDEFNELLWDSLVNSHTMIELKELT